MMPGLAQHVREPDPGGPADVVGVRHERVAPQVGSEDLLTDIDALLLAHVCEAELVEGVLAALDDEGRGVVVELIGVCPDPAVVGVFEDEGEGIVELLVGSEPHELAELGLGVELEHVLVGGAGGRVDAVGAHHHVEPGGVVLG